MNINQLAGDKPERVVLNVRADEAIVKGTIVSLVIDATDDGLAAVTPKTATAAKSPKLAFGVALEAIASGAIGRVQAFGFCRETKIIRATRAATTDAWASTAAGAVGDALEVDTANNALVRASIPASYVTGSAASDTLALDLAMFVPFAVLAQTIVSATTAASTTSNTDTVSTSLVKTFLRML
jgi:hypothetical protein